MALWVVVAVAARAAGPSIDFDGKEAATVGVSVVDLSTGRVVASENQNTAMIPASILKLFTTASALSTIGDNFRFVTKVEMIGDFDGRVLDGDVVVKASGDPTIGSEFFPTTKGLSDSIVTNLKRRGVKEVTGEVYVDEDNFQNPGQNPQWVIEDVGWAYGAGLYGFNYNDNTFKLYPQDSRTVPEVPVIDVVVEKNNQSTDILHGVFSDVYLISGRDVEKKNYYVTTTMNSPAAVFAAEVKRKMSAAGITVREGAVDPSSSVEVVYTHRSPLSGDILKSLMFRSDNMMAEGMLRAQAQGCSRKAAIDAELGYWANRGLSTKYLKIVDGSGLARANRVSAKFLCDVLVAMAKGGKSQEFVKMFPKVGREGTVKNLLKRTPLEGKLVLKSGSMSNVHCYAGYKLSASGKPTHAVVIMVNNFFCSRDLVRRAITRFLTDVFK